MGRKQFWFFFSLFVIFLFSTTVFADPIIGKLLEEALAIRKTGTVEEVSAKFLTTLEATNSKYQRSAIYSIFSEYLIDQSEWEKVITLQQKILSEGDSENQTGPLYNLILAYLEQGDMEKARMAAGDFQGCPQGNYLREYIQYMKTAYPNGIHARIAELLESTPPTPGPLTASKYLSGEEKTAALPVVSTTSLEELPPLPAKEKTQAPSKNRRSDRIEVHVGGWNSELGGHLGSNRTAIDLDNDVSLKSKTGMDISAEVSLTAKDKVKVSYFEFSHTGTLTRTATFDLKTFGPGSSLKLKNIFWDIGGFRELHKDSKKTWGFLYGAKINNSTLKLVQYLPTSRRTGNGDSEFWFPYIGLAGTSQLGKHVGLDGSIKWLSWGGDNHYDTHDFELKLLFGGDYRNNPANTEWYAFLGYRDFRLSGTLDNDSSTTRFSGPIFGLEIRF